MLRIGCDLDDVVYDFVGIWVRKYNLDNADDLKVEDIKDWNFGDADMKCTIEEFRRYLFDPELQLKAKPVMGRDGPSLELIQYISKEINAKFVFITATRTPAAPAKMSKLIADIPSGVDYETHFTREKWLVICDVYMDDNPSDIENYMVYRFDPRMLVIVFDRPWNQEVPAISFEVWAGKITDAMDNLKEEPVPHQARFKADAQRKFLSVKPVRVKDWTDFAWMMLWWSDLCGKTSL